MMKTHPVAETEPAHPTEERTANSGEQPYAIVWMNGKEIELYEDEDGEFFTA